MGGLALPLVALVLGGAFSQFLLGEIRFSSIKAESVFRALFFVPAFIDALLISRCWRRGDSGWRLWVLLAPVWVVGGLMYAALADSDAQAAIFVFLLPFAHAVFSGISYLLSRLPMRIQSP